jgi:predicted secreted protein with PEFG-CTERM motif
VFTSINAIPIGNVSYELVQDPSYKTDQEVKEEYLLKEHTKNDLSAADYKTGLMIEADAVEGSTTITITGHATSITIPVTIMVLAPNGNIVSIDQINIDSDGSFTSIIGVGGPMWKQDGFYSITAQQGSNTLNKSTVEVEIVGGAVIPEFGTVASLILVVAISSIVLLSTKSKLKFQIR